MSDNIERLFGAIDRHHATVVNPDKDRRLRGKKRRAARRQARGPEAVLAGAGAAHAADVRSAPGQPVPVAILDLPTRIKNLLTKDGIVYTDELQRRMDNLTIYDTPGIGGASVKAIREVLRRK